MSRSAERAPRSPVSLSEVHKQGHRTTGHSLETLEFLTKRACALSAYALTCAALKDAGAARLLALTFCPAAAVMSQGSDPR